MGQVGETHRRRKQKASGDVNTAGLRAAIEIAKKANMPKDTIERAVAKGISADAASLESVTYESYGPGGCAIIISTLTDNRNRTAAEIKHLLSRNGLTLATPGSAAWVFEKTTGGYIPKTTVPLSESDNKALMKMVEELDNHDDVEGVYTNTE